MSSQEHLREQVHRLQSLVLDLTAELRELARENKILLVRVGELEGRVNELEEQASDREFSVVKAEPAPASTPAPLVVAPAASSSAVPADRVAIARQIGQWLRKCLGEGPKGKSGRDKISLPSRLYLVVRSVGREIHNPPKVFYSWGAAKPWVSVRGDLGDSVFVGLPTEAEAIEAVQAGEFSLPAELA